MMSSDQIANRIAAEDAIIAENLAIAVAPVIRQFGADGAVVALMAIAAKIQQGEFKSKRMH